MHALLMRLCKEHMNIHQSSSCWRKSLKDKIPIISHSYLEIEKQIHIAAHHLIKDFQQESIFCCIRVSSQMSTLSINWFSQSMPRKKSRSISSLSMRRHIQGNTGMNLTGHIMLSMRNTALRQIPHHLSRLNLSSRKVVQVVLCDPIKFLTRFKLNDNYAF